MKKSKFRSEAETYFAELLQRLGTDLPSQIMCEDEHGSLCYKELADCTLKEITFLPARLDYEIGLLIDEHVLAEKLWRAIFNKKQGPPKALG
jgi:hypothetical protein